MSHALSTARRVVNYVALLEKEIRRLRRERDSLTGALLAAKTAAAHLRDENAQLREALARKDAAA
jgi:FtsZ-binding cell division protein ZapB